MVPGIEKYITKARTDRYNIMCYIDAHKKKHPSSVDNDRSGGGNALPSNFTTDTLASICINFDFIDCWLKWFDHNYITQSNKYIENMQDCLKIIPVQLPKPLSHRGKWQYLLYSIGGDCYKKKINEKLPPLKKRKLRKSTRERGWNTNKSTNIKSNLEWLDI